MPKFKVDFHHHCSTDPMDVLHYSPEELMNESIRHGLNAIAITPHSGVFDDPEATCHAREKGFLLINGIEKHIEGMEVLLLNVTPEEIPRKMNFEDLRRLRDKKGPELFVIAPHPFYPKFCCVGRALDQHRNLFDALEFSHLYLECWNPNEEAVYWSRKNKVPLVANSDTHRLWMLGRNYTEVEASELTARAIFDAIRSGHSTPHVRPPSLWEIGRFALEVQFYQEIFRLLSPSLRSRRRQFEG